MAELILAFILGFIVGAIAAIMGCVYLIRIVEKM
jgi:hypothetical protein